MSAAPSVRLDALQPGDRFALIDAHGAVRGQVVGAGGRGVVVQLEQARRRFVVRELGLAVLVQPEPTL